MKILNNTTEKVIDELRKDISKNSKINIAAASFSIYAYKELKKELEQIEELKFLFSKNLSTEESQEDQSKEFFLASSNIYDSDFDIKLRNELSQKAIAKECADWIRDKVKFRINNTGEFIPNFITTQNQNQVETIQPFNKFSTSELGVTRGKNHFFQAIKISSPESLELLSNFENLWNDERNSKDVTDEVLKNITAAYKENSPELIYYIALYNIFSEFLKDINEDFSPDDRTGFKESKVWNQLFDFQKDAVLGCISKLEKHNGCILADSVGLGKTFSALGIIKYYESRNKNVLVLCPKRLANNWNTYKGNYKNNILAEDRLRYDVLYHTDVNRENGTSNGLDLGMLNWGAYDLVVIDESHNFRNGEKTARRHDETYENRYKKLMNKIIKSGVRTKVLMLSATPVNTDFIDLRNQLLLACEGEGDKLANSLDSKHSLDAIFRNAQKAFSDWSEFTPENRTTENLLSMLDFDFFQLLDSVTIARSRKHIVKYYDNSKIGAFPERLKPISKNPELTKYNTVNYDTIFGFIDQLNLHIYNPLKYVLPSRLSKYIDLDRKGAGTWLNREAGRNQLMMTNLLKRAESSIFAFNQTSRNVYNRITQTLQAIEKFKKFGIATNLDALEFNSDDDTDEFTVGQKFQIKIEDMDYLSWEKLLLEDKEILEKMLSQTEKITPQEDLKLQTLKETIFEKIQSPINSGNKKILIFTAFADTANYLFDNLKQDLLAQNIHSALIEGNNTDTTLTSIRKDFNEVLTAFSPRSKNYDALFNGQNIGEIDIVFATDVISEGQNLQDCDFLINYDIHWNPVRIIQRFGRIDRIGSKNSKIQMVNFWPNITLDKYINLKSRVENRMKLISISTTGENTLAEKDPDLEYRKSQLQRLKDEVIDLEETGGGINIMDLGLNDFHLDVQNLYAKFGDYQGKPLGIHAVVSADEKHPAGAIFVLKNRKNNVVADKQNRLHPFYLVYISEQGELINTHYNPKNILDDFRFLTAGKEDFDPILTADFNEETRDGKNMKKYSDLLAQAIQSLVEKKSERDIDSLFTAGPTSAKTGEFDNIDDFELIDFLVVKEKN